MIQIPNISGNETVLISAYVECGQVFLKIQGIVYPLSNFDNVPTNYLNTAFQAVWTAANQTLGWEGELTETVGI